VCGNSGEGNDDGERKRRKNIIYYTRDFPN
jgi:hypothetical protein